MRILLIKLRHIGDALLMTPALSAVRQQHPDARIWVVVRRGTEGILRGTPDADRVLVSAAPEPERRGLGSLMDELKLVLELRRQRFDVAVDLGDSSRGRWLAWLSGARLRAADAGARDVGGWWRNRFQWLQIPLEQRKRTHRAGKDFLVAQLALGLGGAAGPLRFDADRTTPWNSPTPSRPHVVFHPGTRWTRKRWPVERWCELGRHLQRAGFQIVVSAGPDPEEVAQGAELVSRLGEDAFSTAGRANWSQLAWLLHGARMFVGVDTAAMHLAAACQCPTVTLFGPSKAAYWHPWQVPHRVVSPSAEAVAGLATMPPEERERHLMAAISVSEVVAACEALLLETVERPGPAGARLTPA